MNSFPWLTATAVLPALGAIVLALLPRDRSELAKRLALVFSGAALLLVVAAGLQFDPGAGFQFTEQYSWIPAFGIHYALGVDGIGMLLVALTAVLTPVVILASWNDAETGTRSVRTFFSLVLVLEALAIGVFAATDVFLFYVLFEATLIPVYFLIGSFGGSQRSYAAVKFLIYSLVGGLIMLAGVIGLYVVSAQAGDASFLLGDLAALDIASEAQRWMFLAFFIAFAIKAPLWPVHTWLPDTAGASTPGTTVLIVSVLDKIGTFGMLRFCLQLFPEASRWATPVVIVLAVISVIYGALLAIGQRDIRRLIAYTSMSHFGVMVLAIFAFTTQSQIGASLYMFNHGLSTAALFLIAGYMIRRRQSALMADYGGVDKVAPVLSGTFLFACLSGLALPGLSTFAGEFLSLAGSFSRFPVPAIIATVGIILAALYMLILYQRTMTGPVTPAAEQVSDLNKREVVAIAPLIVLILGLGIFPKPLVDAVAPTIEDTMTEVGVSDPEPAVQLDFASTEGTQ